MEKITIHRALSELKLIDAKIEKQISELIPTGTYQAGKLINGYLQLADFENTAKSRFDSINSQIDRKTKVKTAIVEANAKTMVTVSGKLMTIADAITFKDVIKLKRKFVAALRLRHTGAVAELNRGNDQVSANMQKILEATFGKENVKVTKDDMEAVRKPYMEANEFHLFDPLNVNLTIERLEKEIYEFESEVDAVLSEINAVTLIEF